jgi:NAD+ synthase
MSAERIVLNEIDTALAQREIEDFLIRKIAGAGLAGGVLGMSGGIDSSTVAYLAASAFKRANRGKPPAKRLKLVGLILPSATNDTREEDDARQVAERLGIEYRVIGIQPLIEAFKRVLPAVLREKYHLGNLASEVRAVILSRHAAALRCLVLGTGNRDEDYCLGYFTKRGDGAVDVSPIGALSKRHVRQLAKHLGVPDRIITKAPTAGLWHGQTDEGELGFSYDFAEQVIAGSDGGMSAGDIARALKCRVGDIQKVLRMYKDNRHKMSTPEIAPVTYVSLKKGHRSTADRRTNGR